MRKNVGNLILILVLLAAPVAAKTVRVYISNQDGSSIDVIDASTNKVVQTIKGVVAPDGISITPDKTRGFIPDRNEKVLVVVDMKTGETIKKIPLSERPNLPAISRDGKQVYVAIWPLKADAKTQGAIDIIDTTTLENIKTIPTHGGMHDIYVTNDNKYLVCGSPQGKLLTVIDLKTDEIAWELPFDRGTLAMAIESGKDGSAKRIFLGLVQYNGIAVVDFAKHQEVARLHLPVGKEFEAPGMGGPHGNAITPDGKYLWAVCNQYNAVFVYSLADLKLVGQAPLPGKNKGGEGWIDFTPDGKTAYVALGDHNLISAIDVKTMKEVTQIPVGENPRHVQAVLMP
jgi:YVTN family beta-propeller protein